MGRKTWLYVALIFSLAIILISKNKVNALFAWKYPPLNTLVVTEYFSQDIAFLTQGTHRAAADLAYVQLLQYYGDYRNYYPPGHPIHKEPYCADDHSHHGHHHQDSPTSYENIPKTQSFLRLYELGRRILRLDPFFNGSALEVGGSLGFNVKRPGEALDFLKEAIALDPSYHRYRLYIAAILYRNEGEDQKLIRVLDEAIMHSDCPPLLENILANLHKKNKNFVRAGEIYVHMIKTVSSKSDRDTAQNNLISLLQDHPDIVPAIEPLLQG
ncbi:hypothetical protein BVX98_05060 [bacterium F11]|nr:hypothetical protein BVX98_05060 [bacterium F11]